MWVFTETGFVSAVVHRDDPDILIVRSRDRQSLESLALIVETDIITGAGTDYPHRIKCSRDHFTQWAEHNIASMSYGNFKSRVTQTRGHDFAHALMDVWSIMCHVEDIRR